MKELKRGLRASLPILDDASVNCEWENISNIFSDAIERKGLSEDKVTEMIDKIKSKHKDKPIMIVGDYEPKKEVNTYRNATKEEVTKAIKKCHDKYGEVLQKLADSDKED